MSQSQILGYNILFKIGTKTICGTTQDDINIAARTKESIYKSLQGSSETVVTGHDITFSAQGLCMLDDASTSTVMDMDDMMEQALKTGSNAPIAFVYHRGGGDNYSGNCVITSYKESSNSEDTAEWSCEFKVTGTMSKVTAS